jgi:hypothetical protein
MDEATQWTLSGAAFVVLWGVIIAVAGHFRAKQRLHEREMLHRERMQALEKGVPFADLPGQSPPSVPMDWVGRLLPGLARIVGFAATFVGLGLCAAFWFAPDPGYRDFWTMGLIPALGGIGLLLYGFTARFTTRGDPS